MASTPRLLLLPFDPAKAAREPLEIQLSPFTLGRETDNALVLNGQGVSRHHAHIERCPEGWKLVDLGSSNGTLVNGTRVQSHVLRDGDEVFLGDRSFRFLLSPEGPAPTPAPPPRPPSLPPPLPAYQPPPLPNHRPKPLLWAGIGAGAMGLIAFCIYLIVRPNSFSQARPQAQTLPAAIPTTSPVKTASVVPSPPRPPEVIADPEALAETLKDRFRNGDLEGVLALSHPEMQDTFRKAFQGERERMTRAADLLATRKQVHFESGSLVEFEVRDGGRTFPLTFERLGNTWVLRSM